jgi:AcrR family transcriptional regulator
MSPSIATTPPPKIPRPISRSLSCARERPPAVSDRWLATVYKYFGNKEGLVMELARTVLEELLEEVDKTVSDPPADVTEAVLAALTPLFDSQLSRAGGGSLVRFLMDDMWHSHVDVRRKYSRAVIARYEASIETLLAQFQKRGLIEKRVDTKLAARIINSLVDYNYICFARGEIATIEAMVELAKSQIRMLVGQWRS